MLDKTISHTAFLLLGGNLGNRLSTLHQAKKAINNKVGKIIKASSVYQTAAWGVENQPAFLNQVLAVRTSFTALEVLETILLIEKDLGRERYQKWYARTIDIDIIYFDNQIINENKLKVPHPLLHQRLFTLIPLAEIAPDFVHPILKQTNQELLEICPDQLKVELSVAQMEN